jgi:hypothetical protein
MVRYYSWFTVWPLRTNSIRETSGVYLLWKVSSGLGDDFNFQCEDCCCVSTSYSYSHVSSPLIINVMKFFSAATFSKRHVQMPSQFSCYLKMRTRVMNSVETCRMPIMKHDPTEIPISRPLPIFHTVVSPIWVQKDIDCFDFFHQSTTWGQPEIPSSSHRSQPL